MYVKSNVYIGCVYVWIDPSSAGRGGAACIDLAVVFNKGTCVAQRARDKLQSLLADRAVYAAGINGHITCWYEIYSY